MGLISNLGAGNIGVDTVIFIYFIEDHPKFLPAILPLFQEADQGKRELITSALTLFEVLVVPYRTGNRALAERYEALLTRSRGVRIVDISHDVPPQDVMEAAWLLRTAYRYLPAASVHLVVVDPGVGSSRRAIAVRALD